MNKQEVLDILKGEFDRAQKLESISGYTLWGLATACAGLLWLLLNMLRNGGFDLNSILLVLFLGILLCDSINFFLNLFFSNSYLPEGSKRFVSIFDQTTLGLFRLILWSAAPVLLVLYIQIPLYFKIITYLFYGLLVFFSFLSLVFKFILRKFGLDLFNSNPPPNRWAFAVVVIPQTLVTASLIIFLRSFDFSSIQIIDIQISLILLVLLILVSRLISQYYGKKDNFIIALDDLRRSLVFGEIDPETAFQEAEIMIYGKRLEQLLQNKIKDLIDLYGKGFDILSKIKMLIDKPYKKEVSEEEMYDLLHELESIARDEIKPRMNTLTLQLILAKSLDKALEKEVEGVETKLNQLVDKLHGQIEEIQAITKPNLSPAPLTQNSN